MGKRQPYDGEKSRIKTERTVPAPALHPEWTTVDWAWSAGPRWPLSTPEGREGRKGGVTHLQAFFVPLGPAKLVQSTSVCTEVSLLLRLHAILFLLVRR